MADAFRVCRPFYFISLRIYYNIFVFLCFIYFWFYPGDCDVRSVAGRRSFVCPLCCCFAPGDPPNAAQVLPARHPQSRWHFQGLPDRSRKQILLFFLFYFDRLNLFFFSIRYRSSGPPSGCWTSTTRNFRFTTRSWSACRPGGAAQSWPIRPRSNSTTWTPRTITAPSIRYVHPPEFDFKFYLILN
jgi:hypothetical protein